MATKNYRTLDEIKDSINEAASNYLIAVSANDLESATIAENDIKEYEIEYAETSRVNCFIRIRNADNPMHEAIKEYDYHVIKHTFDRNECGDVCGIKISEARRPIVLPKICRFCGFSSAFTAKISKLNILTRLIGITGITDANEYVKAATDALAKSNDVPAYVIEIARKIESGKTPTSNTQICKLLQEIYDDILFIDNGDGKNVLRATNYDVNFFKHRQSKAGKHVGSVAFFNDSKAVATIFEMMHCKLLAIDYTAEIPDVETKSK